MEHSACDSPFPFALLCVSLKSSVENKTSKWNLIMHPSVHDVAIITQALYIHLYHASSHVLIKENMQYVY